MTEKIFNPRNKEREEKIRNEQIQACEEKIVYLQQQLKEAKKRKDSHEKIHLIKEQIKFLKAVIQKHLNEE